MESEEEKIRIRNLEHQFKIIIKKVKQLKQCSAYAHYEEAEHHSNEILQILKGTLQYSKQEVIYVSQIVSKNHFQTKKIIQLQKEVKYHVDLCKIYDKKLKKTLQEKNQLEEENTKLKDQLLRECDQSSICEDNTSSVDDIPDYQSLYMSRMEEINPQQVNKTDLDNRQNISEQEANKQMKEGRKNESLDEFCLNQSKTKSKKEQQKFQQNQLNQ